MMRFSTAAVMASLLAASSGAAFASAVTGDEISVNPIAAGGGVLLYPGGQYMRVVHPLLEPGEKTGPVQLHMPGKHVARAHAPRAPSDTAAIASAPAVEAPAPKPQPKPKPKRVAVAPAPAPVPAAPASGGYNPGYGNFGQPQGAAGLNFGSAPVAPAPAPPPPRQVAKANPPPSSAAPTGAATTPGLTKRSVILFAAGASDPAQSALGAIKFLAGDLNASMSGPGSRVQILAYGGDKGDKGSDARRLSLKRALAIRQVLIDDGVASERIDVRAMGGADDGGPADRVDVYVKA